MPDVPGKYAAIFIDEGHGMGEKTFDSILEYGRVWNAPIIISYDDALCVSEKERLGMGAAVFEKRDDFKGFKLTNKIRMNNELSTFLRTFLSASKLYKREYPNVSVSYGADIDEAMNLIRFYEKEGYMFIWDRKMGVDIGSMESFPGEALTRIESASVTGKEFDKVLMLLDDSFYYDEERFLRNTESENGEETSRIMNLFHGLSRAKKQIALVIMGNVKLMQQVN